MALWAAQVLSQTAANAVTSALIILVAELTHSNTSSSLLILLAIVPAVLFGIAGGVIVDPNHRRLVPLVTNATPALAILPPILVGPAVPTASPPHFLLPPGRHLRVPRPARPVFSLG